MLKESWTQRTVLQFLKIHILSKASLCGVLKMKSHKLWLAIVIISEKQEICLKIRKDRRLKRKINKLEKRLRRNSNAHDNKSKIIIAWQTKVLECSRSISHIQTILCRLKEVHRRKTKFVEVNKRLYLNWLLNSRLVVMT